MNKQQRRLIYLVASFAVLAFFLTVDPMNLSLIEQDEPLVGALTKGDFLVLFSLFCGTVTVIMFFSTGRWRTKR